jgi:acetate kinase
VLESMEWLGIELDPHRNRVHAEIISSDRSAVRVFVVQTNEELLIARHTSTLLAKSGTRSEVAVEGVSTFAVPA